MLKPEVGPGREHRLLDRLTFWRSAVGLATIAVITFRHDHISAIFTSFWKMLLTTVVALLLPPVSLLVLLIISRSGHRAQLLRGAVRLLRRAALAVAVVGVPIVLLVVTNGGTTSLNWVFHPLGFLVFLSLPFLFVWYCCFGVCTVYWAARTGIWSGEIHPLLPPIGTTLIMLMFNGFELWEADPEGKPFWLWLTLNLGGTITALLLAVAEYRLLWIAGYRWRGGPEPITGGAPGPAPQAEPGLA